MPNKSKRVQDFFSRLVQLPAADVLKDHTTLEVESLDRIYLKVIQMRLQDCSGIAWYFRKHRGEAFATAKVMADMTRPFVNAIEKYAETNAIPLMTLNRGQRKDDLAKQALADFPDREGILFIGKALHNLPALREVAFAANRRLLHVQKLSHDPMLGDEEFQSLTSPQEVDGQRVSGLKFADPMVLAVLTALLMFRFLPQGFRNGDLRRDVSQLLARPAHDLSPGQMTYQLRRLRLRGLIKRIPGTQRYEVTDTGQRMATHGSLLAWQPVTNNSPTGDHRV